MSIGHYIKIIFLVGGVTLLHAEIVTHPYEVESGMVLYEISGGTQLTPETNLTIKGKAKLRFKDWGEVKLEELETETKGTGFWKQEIMYSCPHCKSVLGFSRGKYTG